MKHIKVLTKKEGPAKAIAGAKMEDIMRKVAGIK